MDNNVNNSRSNEKQPSVGSKITSEEKKFTESASTFVNQAEIAWHERRHEWAGDLSQKSLRMPKDPILSWSLTYDDLLLTNDPFPQPIPLTMMVYDCQSLWQMVKVCKPQGSGFSALLLTAKAKTLSIHLLFRYLLNISFFISGLYVLAPIYHTLTRSISSVSIWALTAFLLIVHLFLHDYAGSTIRPPGALTNPTLTSNISLNASIVASVLIASRLPSRLLVFAIVLFSLQVFLFAPLVTYCIKKYSFKLHLLFSFGLMIVTLGLVFVLHRLLFVLLFSLLIFVTILCPYWLIKIQEYKFEINGPWDEAKLCFDITE